MGDMGIAWKVAVGLVLLLPMTGYVVGSLVAAADPPREHAPIIVQEQTDSPRPSKSPSDKPRNHKGDRDDRDDHKGEDKGDDDGDDDPPVVIQPSPSDLFDDDDFDDDDDGDDDNSGKGSSGSDSDSSGKGSGHD
jgi:hypothetical protein